MKITIQIEDEQLQPAATATGDESRVAGQATAAGAAPTTDLRGPRSAAPSVSAVGSPAGTPAAALSGLAGALLLRYPTASPRVQPPAAAAARGASDAGPAPVAGAATAPRLASVGGAASPPSTQPIDHPAGPAPTGR